MGACNVCGADAGLLSSYCSKCARERWVTPPEATDQAEQLRPDGLAQRTTEDARVSPATAAWRGSTELCILLGLACLAIGAYLLIDPTVTVPGYAGIGREKVANIHMMTLGETLSIVGAIFLAAGIRPR